MRVLITGVTGFCGSHLAEAMVKRGDEVWGICRQPDHDEHLAAIRGKIQLRAMDLASHDAGVGEMLREAHPSVIYHLAGEASTRASLQHPRETIVSNVAATANLLEACRRLQNHAGRPWTPDKIILFTSSEMYGTVSPDQIPLTEDAPLRPSHPYATSKACVHHLGQMYWKSYGLPIVEARSFNQIGPRQKLGFVVPDFAHQVADIMNGRREPCLRVGSLSDRRDFTDVRDVVRANVMLAERGKIGEVYHTCSGRAVPVQHILDILVKAAGTPIRVEVDPAKLRPSQMPIIQGSFKKLQSETGWTPEIPLEISVQDTLHYWRQKAGEGQTARRP